MQTRTAALVSFGAAMFVIATAHGVRAQVEPGEDARRTDAAIDRVLLLPSAETHPEGAIFASDYEVVGLSFGYALTDDIEVTLAGTPPLPDLPFAYELGGKLNVIRESILRAALFASFGIFVSNDRQLALGGRIGGSLGLCLDEACGSYATLSGGVLLTDQVATMLPMAVGFGVVARLDRYVALVVETLYGRAIDTRTVRDDDVFVLSYAARIGADDWSLDVGFVRPFVDEIEDSPLVIGVPWLAFTYRVGIESVAPGPSSALAHGAE